MAAPGGAPHQCCHPAVDATFGQPEVEHTPVAMRACAVRPHGTILARRALMLPHADYWTHITAAGNHAYVAAGVRPIGAVRRSLATKPDRTRRLLRRARLRKAA